MPQTQLKFKINHPHVVAECFDAEVVAINLNTGSYYSMGKSGVTIWALVSTGARLHDIMAEVNQRCSGEPPAMKQAAQKFMAELQQPQLIVVQANGNPPDFSAPSTSSTAPLCEKMSFDPPVLCEYSDMQDLLLLDPIHEVDSQGWPKKQTLN